MVKLRWQKQRKEGREAKQEITENLMPYSSRGSCQMELKKDSNITIMMAFEASANLEQIDHFCHLRVDKHAMALLFQLEKQPIKHCHLATVRHESLKLCKTCSI
jgi:hypothetical protein